MFASFYADGVFMEKEKSACPKSPKKGQAVYLSLFWRFWTGTFFLAFLIQGQGVKAVEKSASRPSEIRVLNKIIRAYSYKRISDTLALARTVYEISEQYRMDPLMILAVIHEESHFRVRAAARRGALGLMQLTPEMGHHVAGQLDLIPFTKEHLFDPGVNIRLGAYRLKTLKKQFQNNRLLFLTAYNIGADRLLKLRKKHGYLKYDYARKVLGTYRRFIRDSPAFSGKSGTVPELSLSLN